MNVWDILIRNEACVYCGLARKQACPHLSLQPPVHTGCTQATSGITAGSVASSLGPDSDKGPGVLPRSWASRGEQVTLGPLSQAVWVTVEVPGVVWQAQDLKSVSLSQVGRSPQGPQSRGSI